MSDRWLRRIARRIVPPDWREDVGRDLAEDLGDGVRADLNLLAIGLRLRGSRAVDVLGTLHLKRIRNPMRDMTRDLRLAIRHAVRQPLYSLAVIATLAIGIGSTTAIYSMFNWILFRPLPGAARPDELVTMRFQSKQRNANFWVAYRDYADLRDGMQSVTALAGSAHVKMDVSVGGDPRRLDGEVVTTNYLSMFGVRPIAGRDFLPAEERPGTHEPAAIISRRYWQQAFGGEESAVGRILTIDGRRFTIAGIAPAGFQGRSLVTVTDVWIPVGAYPTLQPQQKDLLTSRRATLFGDAFARLRPGVTVEQAEAEAQAIVANTPEWALRTPTAKRTNIGPVLAAGIGVESFSQPRLRTVFGLLMGAVTLLLLLACANAANLLLARVMARRRELAVAHAIGASRFRIARQHLVEGAVLAVSAGVAGLAIAQALLWLFDGMAIIASVPAVTGVGIDGRVLAFSLAASLVTGVVFAVAPAVAGSRVDLQSALKDGVTATKSGRQWLRGSLVTLQVTISIVLLIAGGLFVRTLQNIRALDVGFKPDGLISFSVNPGRYGYDDTRSQAYFDTLLRRLAETPGIDRAAFSWTTSFTPNRADTAFVVDGRAEPVPAPTTFVSRGFFDTMGLRLAQGRDFTDQEIREASETASAVIVSRRLATKLFPEGSVIGRQVTLMYPKGKVVQIVGIADDVRGRRLTAEPEGFAYFPEPRPEWGTVQVRSRLPDAAAIAVIRDAARAVDPLVMPADLERFDAAIDRALSEERLFARLTMLFAVIAALIAGIGIFGMTAGAVTERRHEFGIRVALGASARSVFGLVLRHALLLAAVGAVLGVAGAAALRKLIESRLYGVAAFDPLTVAAAVVALLAVAVVAGLIPGVRATRVNPVRSLRQS